MRHPTSIRQVNYETSQKSWLRPCYVFFCLIEQIDDAMQMNNPANSPRLSRYRHVWTFLLCRSVGKFARRAGCGRTVSTLCSMIVSPTFIHFSITVFRRLWVLRGTWPTSERRASWCCMRCQAEAEVLSAFVVVFVSMFPFFTAIYRSVHSRRVDGLPRTQHGNHVCCGVGWTGV